MHDEVDNKKVYLDKLQKLLADCLEDDSTHAVLVVGNDSSHTMNLFAVNATELEVGILITAAAGYVIEDAGKERTIN